MPSFIIGSVLLTDSIEYAESKTRAMDRASIELEMA